MDDARMDGRKDERTDNGTNARTDGPANHGRTDNGTNGRTDSQDVLDVHGDDGRTDRRTMDGRTTGRTDGRTLDGRTVRTYLTFTGRNATAS